MDYDYRQYDNADSDSNTDLRGKGKTFTLHFSNVAIGNSSLRAGLRIGNYEIVFACLRDKPFHFFLVAELDLYSSLFTDASFCDLRFDLRNPWFVSLRVGKHR